MRDTWVKILGTRYKVEFKKESEDEVLKEAHGYCDITGKRIVVISEERENNKFDDFQYLQKKTLRHEIIHAFIYESGLFNNTYCVDSGWASNEEMVDWIAIQSPKFLQVFRELDVL